MLRQPIASGRAPPRFAVNTPRNGPASIDIAAASARAFALAEADMRLARALSMTKSIGHDPDDTPQLAMQIAIDLSAARTILQSVLGAQQQGRTGGKLRCGVMRRIGTSVEVRR